MLITIFYVKGLTIEAWVPEDTTVYQHYYKKVLKKNEGKSEKMKTRTVKK